MFLLTLLCVPSKAQLYPGPLDFVNNGTVSLDSDAGREPEGRRQLREGPRFLAAPRLIAHVAQLQLRNAMSIMR